MKVLLFASCQKTFNYLKNIHSELLKRNYDSAIIHHRGNHTGMPFGNYTMEVGNFSYHNEIVNDVFGQWASTGNSPDFLFVARERWEPELSVIKQMKQFYPNIKVCLVEINTPLYCGIEMTMEQISREKLGNDFININFEHSKNTLDIRKMHTDWTGWDNSVIVGNPYWDMLKTIDVSECAKKYNVDKNKEQLLFFSTISGTRPKVLKALENIANTIDRDKYQIYYKPFPAEPTDPNWQPHQFKFDGVNQPTFYLDDIIDGVIYNQIDLPSMMNICEYHIGNISSVNYASVLLNKQLVSLDDITDNTNRSNDLDFYKSNEAEQDGMRADFWMRIHNFRDINHFEEVAGRNIDKFIKNNRNIKTKI